jgi:hypothetical protein
MGARANQDTLDLGWTDEPLSGAIAGAAEAGSAEPDDGPPTIAEPKSLAADAVAASHGAGPPFDSFDDDEPTRVATTTLLGPPFEEPVEVEQDADVNVDPEPEVIEPEAGVEIAIVASETSSSAEMSETSSSNEASEAEALPESPDAPAAVEAAPAAEVSAPESEPGAEPITARATPRTLPPITNPPPVELARAPWATEAEPSAAGDTEGAVAEPEPVAAAAALAAVPTSDAATASVEPVAAATDLSEPAADATDLSEPAADATDPSEPTAEAATDLSEPAAAAPAPAPASVRPAAPEPTSPVRSAPVAIPPAPATPVFVAVPPLPVAHIAPTTLAPTTSDWNEFGSPSFIETMKRTRPTSAWTGVALFVAGATFVAGIAVGRGTTPPSLPVVAVPAALPPSVAAQPVSREPAPPAATSDTQLTLTAAIAGATKPTAPAKPLPPFDAKAARAAIDAAAARTKSCRQGGAPKGAAATTITFAPSGKVSTVAINTTRYAGTATGQCIATRLSEAQIPEFGGNPGILKKTIAVR